MAVTSKAHLLHRLELAVERAIAALDALDGDPDLEEQCEDEGAQCEGEGEIGGDMVPEYGLDQRKGFSSEGFNHSWTA